MKDTVLIAGGGIGGLTAALCLVDRGYDVKVLEQASQMRAVGAGIQLSANATRVLLQCGLGPALSQITVKPGGKCIRLWNTGQTWQLFDLGTESIERYGAPYMMLYRPELLTVLMEALAARSPTALQLGAKVSEATQSDSGVEVTLADGRRLVGAALIGADGVHSIVRSTFVAVDRPRFSGCIAWRGVIPIERLPRSMQGVEGVNWVGPGGHVIHYPISAGRMVGFTGIVETDEWQGESWTATGSTQECLDCFPGWHADIHALIREVPEPMRWAMMVRDPLPAWTNGRVTLLGDAAHPTLPFLAQGAGMAIEDGCVLARALEADPDNVERGLRSYEATRLERTMRIVQASAANAGRFHSDELAHADTAAAYVEREWQLEKPRSGYEWLFAYQPETVALADPGDGDGDGDR